MSDLIDRDKAMDVLDDFQSLKEDGAVNAYAVSRHRMATIPSAEPTWASVLAELHERFDALEKELCRASAEMSAIIREYVDGQKDEPQTNYVLSKDSDAYKFNKRMEIEEGWLKEQSGKE